MIDGLAVFENVITAAGGNVRYLVVEYPVQYVYLMDSVFEQGASFGVLQISPVGGYTCFRIRVFPTLRVPIATKQIRANELDFADFTRRRQFMQLGMRWSKALLETDVE